MIQRWRMMIAIISRDWIAMTRSPHLWIATMGFSTILGLIFCLIVNSTHQSDAISIMVAAVGFILMIVSPLLASKSIIDDCHLGLEDVLFSSPMPTSIWVIARWASGMIATLALLLSTLGIVVALCLFGHPDIGTIVTAYLGWSAMGSAFVAMGVWAAVVGRSSIGSALLSIVTLLLLWLLAPLSVLTSGRTAELLRETSLVHHTYGFEQGVIVGADIAYFSILTLVFIGLSIAILNSRRLE